jgi:rhodanese-related sulfurtransferase
MNPRRRIALATGTVLLLGAVFILAFTNPQVFSLAGTGPMASTNPPQTVVEEPAKPLKELTPVEVKAMQDRGEPLILADVRGASSFGARHITGARSMPASEMETWGPKLPRNELVVFYCSCPDDHSSSATARMVQEQYAVSNVAVLKGGLRAWEKEGLPMTLEDSAL